MSSEHVEVLRELEQDGDAGLTEREREAIRQVIAALSAQQPPAETQPVGVEGFRDWVIEQMPAGTVIDNPELWAERLARAYELNVPTPSTPVGAAEEMVLDAIERRAPVAPVGVEEFESRLRGRYGPFTAQPGERYVDADIALAVLREALAQQPAAVDEADGDTIADVIAYFNGLGTKPAKRMAEAVVRLQAKQREAARTHGPALLSALEDARRYRAMRASLLAQDDLWMETLISCPAPNNEAEFDSAVDAATDAAIAEGEG